MPSLSSLARISKAKLKPLSTHVPSKFNYTRNIRSSFLMSKLSALNTHQIPTIPNKAISIAARARQAAYSSPTIKLHTITSQKRFYSDTSNISKPREARLIGETVDPTIAYFTHSIHDKRLLVDKSEAIEEFWKGPACQLIVRPRRFGKTSFMSLLQCFFAKEVNGIETKGMFDAFAIAKVNRGDFMRQHQGKYPVIFVSFKDIKERNYKEAIQGFRNLFSELYRQHANILNSDKLSNDDKRVFRNYLEGTLEKTKLANALQFLSEMLYKSNSGQRVIILIDEYDAPLTAAYEHKFSEELGGFMRNMFSAALKDNPYVQKSLMAGVLRVSQSCMLSGLNNLVTYTVLNPHYQHTFGFEEAEVEALLTKTKVMKPSDSATFAGVKALYNGYKVGGTVLYNPWSIMQLISQEELKPYWVLTANDVLLKKVLTHSNEEAKAKLARLMLGETGDDLDIIAIWRIFNRRESGRSKKSRRASCSI